MMTHTLAAKDMKKSSPSKRLPDLLLKSIEQYNQSVTARAFSVSADVRKMLVNLAKCPSSVMDTLQLHYLSYRHQDSGTLVLEVGSSCRLKAMVA